MQERKPKAADIPDSAIIDAIDAVGHEVRGVRYAAWQYVAERFPEFPAKVVLAKMRQMVNGNRLEAECTCGCSGSYRQPAVQ